LVFGQPASLRSAKATFSRTLIESNKAPFWKTMVTRLRIGVHPSFIETEISWPSTWN